MSVDDEVGFSPLSQVEAQWRDFILSISVEASDVYLYSSGLVVVRERRKRRAVELPLHLRGRDAFVGFFDAFLGRGELQRLHEERERCDYAISLGKVRFRVSTGLGAHGEDITMRRIRGEIPDREFVKAPADLIKACCETDGGLIIAAGATGKGKSSLLAGLIQERADVRGGQFDTLEDPIEFIFKNNPEAGAYFRQRELNRDFRSFVGGFRDELRRAFDVLLVQEIRDPEVMEMAVNAALSGHVVFATVHGENVKSAVSRCCDMLSSTGRTDTVGAFADALRVVVAIDLIAIPDELGGGMCPIHEVLINDPKRGVAIPNYIRSRKFELLDAEIDMGKGAGMQTFDLAKKRRVDEGFLPRSILRASNYS